MGPGTGSGTKEVTLGEVAEAIRLNGWPKATHAYVDWDDNGKVKAACAIAQGAIRLGVNYHDLVDFLNSVTIIDDYGQENRLASWIMSQNDGTSITVGELGYHVKRKTAALGGMRRTVKQFTYKT